MITQEELNKNLKQVFKPYRDLGKKLEKIYGKEKAKEMVNAKVQYDFRGLFGG